MRKSLLVLSLLASVATTHSADHTVVSVADSDAVAPQQSTLWEVAKNAGWAAAKYGSGTSAAGFTLQGAATVLGGTNGVPAVQVALGVGQFIAVPVAFVVAVGVAYKAYNNGTVDVTLTEEQLNTLIEEHNRIVEAWNQAKFIYETRLLEMARMNPNMGGAAMAASLDDDDRTWTSEAEVRAMYQMPQFRTLAAREKLFQSHLTKEQRQRIKENLREKLQGAKRSSERGTAKRDSEVTKRKIRNSAKRVAKQGE